jgi:hypothetical protein
MYRATGMDGLLSGGQMIAHVKLNANGSATYALS